MAEGWYVERTTPQIITPPGGRSVEVMRVDFVTDGGSRSYVTIPFEQFSAERARALIEPIAAELIAAEHL
jgi:hypothetical protein